MCSSVFCLLKPLSALSPVWCLDAMASVPGTPGCDTAAKAVPGTSTNKSHMHPGAPFSLWCFHRRRDPIKKSDAHSPVSNPICSMYYSNYF